MGPPIFSTTIIGIHCMYIGMSICSNTVKNFLVQFSCIPYTMKVSRQKTFAVSASHRSSRKNFRGFP